MPRKYTCAICDVCGWLLKIEPAPDYGNPTALAIFIDDVERVAMPDATTGEMVVDQRAARAAINKVRDHWLKEGKCSIKIFKIDGKLYGRMVFKDGQQHTEDVD